jgi:homoserine kinase
MARALYSIWFRVKPTAVPSDAEAVLPAKYLIQDHREKLQRCTFMIAGLQIAVPNLLLHIQGSE